MNDALDELKGELKEKVGEATDNRDLEAEGKAEQLEADLHEAAESVKEDLSS